MVVVSLYQKKIPSSQLPLTERVTSKKLQPFKVTVQELTLQFQEVTKQLALQKNRENPGYTLLYNHANSMKIIAQLSTSDSKIRGLFSSFKIRAISKQRQLLKLILECT